MRKSSTFLFAVTAIVLSGIVGVILVRVAADRKAHHVDLKWNPPSTAAPGSTVAAYDIYRGTRPGGPYQKIASGAKSPSYSDHNVSRGNTYYYVVRTVDSTGRDSSPSNEVSAALP